MAQYASDEKGLSTELKRGLIIGAVAIAVLLAVISGYRTLSGPQIEIVGTMAGPEKEGGAPAAGQAAAGGAQAPTGPDPTQPQPSATGGDMEPPKIDPSNVTAKPTG